MRFAFIHGEKADYAVRRLCRVLEVTPSGYYAWLHRGPSAHHRDNDRLKVRHAEDRLRSGVETPKRSAVGAGGAAFAHQRRKL